jgi:hypothetical protein
VRGVIIDFKHKEIRAARRFVENVTGGGVYHFYLCHIRVKGKVGSNHERKRSED